MNHDAPKTRLRIRHTWKREEEDALRRRAKSQIAAIGTGTKETLGIDTHSLKEEAVMRLWSNVGVTNDTQECWLWKGCKNCWGYGVIGIGTKAYAAHRLVFLFHFGISIGRWCVLHKCDTPLCCNPTHLFIGTPLDNMLDRDRKGRQAKGDKSGSRLHPESLPRGESHYAAKLTEENVIEIRKRQEGATALARKFKVSVSIVKHILQRRKWAHLP